MAGTAMNPFGFAYSSLEGVDAFAKPGAVILTGRGNRDDLRFQDARKKGAELWAYWGLIECYDTLKDPQEQWQYQLADGSHPPLWPYKDANGNPRSNWAGTHLLDIRPGSAWLKHIVPKTGELIDKRLHDGLLLDVQGARLWSKLADWLSWPVEEQTLWVNSMVNLSREIAEVCAGRVKIVHNNLWANVLPKTHPAYAIAPLGEQYCNGVMLENPSGELPSEFHKAYAARTFGLLPRRVPVVDRTDAEAVAWSKVPGVTHVCSVEKAVGETYAKITPPVVPYDGVPVEEITAENLELRARVAEVTAENTTLCAQLDECNAHLVEAEAEVSRLATKINRIDAEVHAT